MIMKITGTRKYIDVEYNGKTARFGGELGMKGFYAIANSMKWLSPHEHLLVTETERATLVKAVLKESEGREFQIYFE
jgi:hypothetical protein